MARKYDDDAIMERPENGDGSKVPMKVWMEVWEGLRKGPLSRMRLVGALVQMTAVARRLREVILRIDELACVGELDEIHKLILELPGGYLYPGGAHGGEHEKLATAKPVLAGTPWRKVRRGFVVEDSKGRVVADAGAHHNSVEDLDAWKARNRDAIAALPALIDAGVAAYRVLRYDYGDDFVATRQLREALGRFAPDKDDE